MARSTAHGGLRGSGGRSGRPPRGELAGRLRDPVSGGGAKPAAAGGGAAPPDLAAGAVRDRGSRPRGALLLGLAPLRRLLCLAGPNPTTLSWIIRLLFDFSFRLLSGSNRVHVKIYLDPL